MAQLPIKGTSPTYPTKPKIGKIIDSKVPTGKRICDSSQGNLDLFEVPLAGYSPYALRSCIILSILICLLLKATFWLSRLLKAPHQNPVETKSVDGIMEVYHGWTTTIEIAITIACCCCCYYYYCSCCCCYYCHYHYCYYCS